jgi:hypothetical protein
MPYCVYCNKYFSNEQIEQHQSSCSEKPGENSAIHFKSFYKYDKLNANILWPIDVGKQKKYKKKKK